MRGNTHACVGIASLAVISLADNFLMSPYMILGSFLGAIIPDIDIKGSLISKYEKVLIVLVSIYIVGIFISPFNRNPIFLNHKMKLLGISIIVISSIFSRLSGHRRLSHSVLGMFLFSLGFNFIYKPILISFIIGYASHLLIDFLNMQGEIFLYPFSKEFSIKLWQSNNIIANIIISVISLVIFTVAFFRGISM